MRIILPCADFCYLAYVVEPIHWLYRGVVFFEKHPTADENNLASKVMQCREVRETDPWIFTRVNKGFFSASKYIKLKKRK